MKNNLFTKEFHIAYDYIIIERDSEWGCYLMLNCITYS